MHTKWMTSFISEWLKNCILQRIVTLGNSISGLPLMKTQQLILIRDTQAGQFYQVSIFIIKKKSNNCQMYKSSK